MSAATTTVRSACRVLVVEDDRDASEVMAFFIGQRANCEVWVAGSVGEALGTLHERLPTHVLLDLMLPDYAGAELLRVVREHNLSVRVAIVTAAGPDSRVVSDAMRWRPDALFQKPVRLADVSDW